MASIQSMTLEMDERTIARKVGIPHDEARVQYSLRSNTVNSYQEFSDIISDYYNHHFSFCVSNGGRLSQAEAASRAKKLVDQEYRKKNSSDLVGAFNNANNGTDGGLRKILDIIAENLKSESVENYVSNIFDRYIEPNSWDQKVDMIRQFIEHYGEHLSQDIQTDKPERYASNYRALISSYVQGLRLTSSVFRRH